MDENMQNRPQEEPGQGAPQTSEQPSQNTQASGQDSSQTNAASSENKQSLSPEDQKDIEENKVIAALSYLGILVIIPLLLKRDSKFAMFHAQQGLIFLIIFVVGWVIFWIPLLGWLLWAAVVVVDIIALVQALSGKYWEVPVIGGLAKKLNL